MKMFSGSFRRRSAYFYRVFYYRKGSYVGLHREDPEQKVKEGVEVRILYDGMNSFSNLPHDYPEGAGGKGDPLPDL